MSQKGMNKIVLITESQAKMLLQERESNSHIVKFGEPEPFGPKQYKMPVTIDGVDYSYEEIGFLIEPHHVNGNELYQPHIHIAPELQKQGFGYAIYKEFINEYGNLYSSQWCVTNETGAIKKIYERLAEEPNFDSIKGDGYIIIYLK